jgi:signal transduction histidine kinase/CheY-like chemotaxis protein
LKKLFTLFTALTNLGVNNNLKVDEVQRVRLTNILGLIPMGMYLVYIVFGLLNQYYFPVVLCSCLLVVSIWGIVLNKNYYYGFSKLLLFGVNGFCVFISYNCLNIDYSVCCYFFPLLMAYQILFDLRKEKKWFLYSVALTFVFAVGCFVLPKGVVYFFVMNEELLKNSRMLNYIMPFFISVFFMLVIMRMYMQTQDKLIEAKEEAEKAYKAKSSFLSNMSHELRTPLNGIIGSTNLLLHENLSLSQKRYFDIIQYSSEHMINLVNHVLDFSKIEAGKLELDSNTFNVKEVVERVCNVFQNQHNHKTVSFIKEIDTALDVFVLSDDMRLSQVLQNILSNAFKFTRKGSVTIVAKCMHQINNVVNIFFSITDTGIGIKKEAQHRIFDSFTQAESGTSRNYGGTGLGLSICKELIEKFGGNLQLKSEYGQGSEFSFTIELNTTVQVYKNEEINGHNTLQFLTGVRILVAEDNAVNMLLVRNFLKKWNAQVTEVVNGNDAVLAHKKQDFDLILMDLEMPVMDGYGAIKEIRKMDEKIPVLAFTAALYDDMLNDLTSKGFNDFIHKPFKPQQLLQKIQQYKQVLYVGT